MSVWTQYRARIDRSEALQAALSSAALLVFRVLGTLITFGYTILMARLLSPGEFGTVWSIWSAAMIASSFVMLNLSAISIREVVRALAQGHRDAAAGFVIFVRKVIVFMTAPVVLAFLAFQWWRAPGTLSEDWIGYLCAALAIPLMGWVQSNAAHGVALHHPVKAQLPRQLIRPALFMIILGVGWQVGVSFSVSSILSIYLLCVAANVALQSFLLRDAFEFMQGVTPKIEGARDWIITSAYLVPTKFLSEKLKDVLIVAASLAVAPAAVGLIAIALSLVNILNFAITAVEISFSAKVSTALNKDKPRRAIRFMAISGALKLGAVLVGGCLLLVLIGPLVGLFGAEYRAAAPAAIVLLSVPAGKALLGKPELVLQVMGFRTDLFRVAVVTVAALIMGPLVLSWSREAVTALDMAWTFAITLVLSQTALWCLCMIRTGIDCSAPGAAYQTFVKKPVS